MSATSTSNDAGSETAVTTESEAGNLNAELTEGEERRRSRLEKIQEKADEQLENFDEGTIGYSIGEILDELGGATEKDPELNEDVGFDVAGNLNAGDIHKAKTVYRELKEVFENE
jgi:hypothetical protein